MIVNPAKMSYHLVMILGGTSPGHLATVACCGGWGSLLVSTV